MSVYDKIKQSRRGLKRIDALSLDIDQATDFIGSFFTTVSSIPDYLLGDYAKKYALSISLNSNSIRRNFETQAIKNSNECVWKFYFWFRSRLCYIERRDQIGRFIHTTRNMDIHREIQPPNQVKIELGDMTVLKNIKRLDVPEDKYNPAKISPPERMGKVRYFFDDLGYVDSYEAGKHYLGLMEKFVSDAEKLWK